MNMSFQQSSLCSLLRNLRVRVDLGESLIKKRYINNKHFIRLCRIVIQKFDSFMRIASLIWFDITGITFDLIELHPQHTGATAIIVAPLRCQQGRRKVEKFRWPVGIEGNLSKKVSVLSRTKLGNSMPSPPGTLGSAGHGYQPGFKQVNREGSKFESTTSMSFM